MTHQTTTRPVQEATDRLHSQVAISAKEFGALLGMDAQQTALAIAQKRLGVPTFQIVEKGRHMVASQAALEFFIARGIDL